MHGEAAGVYVGGWRHLRTVSPRWETESVARQRQQAHLDAPIADVWELVGTPARHPEWWPLVVSVDGVVAGVGDDYVQVTRGPMKSTPRTTLVIDRFDELREIRMRCQESGLYSHWTLTEAQEGTFVDLEMGMEATDASNRAFDLTAGRLYYRRWVTEALAALRTAATRPTA